MSTLSVPLPHSLLEALEHLVRRGRFSSKAEVARKALERYLEDVAVEEVLLASREPRLKGDLDTLAKKLRV